MYMILDDDRRKRVFSMDDATLGDLLGSAVCRLACICRRLWYWGRLLERWWGLKLRSSATWLRCSDRCWYLLPLLLLLLLLLQLYLPQYSIVCGWHIGAGQWLWSDGLL